MNQDHVSTPSRRAVLQVGLYASAAALGAGGLSAILSACGSSASATRISSGKTATAAQVAAASGQIGVLTFTFYESADLNTGPVKATYATTASTDDQLAKMRSRATHLEIVDTGSNVMDEMYAVKRLTPIQTDVLTNYHQIEPALRDYPLFRRNANVYAVPFAVAPGLLAWDSKRVPEPANAQQLLGTEYRNRVGIVDASDALLMVHRALGGDITNFTTADLDNVLSFLKKLRPNIRTLYAFGSEVDLLGRGDVSVVILTFGSLISSARKANPAVRANFLGAISYVDCWSIVEGTDAAKALNWIDSSLTPKGQKAIQTSSGGFPSVSADIDVSQLPTELQGVSLAKLLQLAPITPGVPVESGGDRVTVAQLQNAWIDFKANF